MHSKIPGCRRASGSVEIISRAVGELMIIVFSCNSPGVYYAFSNGANLTGDPLEELIRLECCKPVSSNGEREFVLSHIGEFKPCPYYQGASSWYGEYHPPKKEVNRKPREVEHLTFSLESLVKEALKQ